MFFYFEKRGRRIMYQTSKCRRWKHAKGVKMSDLSFIAVTTKGVPLRRERGKVVYA